MTANVTAVATFHRLYTVTECVGMLREAGFEQVGAFGAFDEAVPPSTKTRLVLHAR